MAWNGGVFSETPFEGRDLAVVFVGYPLGVVAVLWVFTAGVGIDGDPAVVVAAVVPLVPFLFVLGFSGQLEEIRGGPIGVIFQEAHQTIQPVGLREEQVEIESLTIERAAIDYEQYLADFEGRAALWISLGDEPSHEDLRGYLTYMRQLEYVVFIDDGQFAGMMPATTFRSQYALDPERLYEHVESKQILDSVGVVSDFVGPDTTNVEALEVMDRAGTDFLPVVEREEGHYDESIGVVSQDAITRGLILELLRQDRPAESTARGTKS